MNLIEIPVKGAPISKSGPSGASEGQVDIPLIATSSQPPLEQPLEAAATPVAASLDTSPKVPPLVGSPEADQLTGTGASDLIFGLDGDDILRGDPANAPFGGDDRIYGGTGDDLIGGKGGNDVLFGEDGDDRIWGDAGDDILRGGLGNDILTGDNLLSPGGIDTFVLAVGEGTDTITDFEVGIDFIGLADGLTFGALSFSGNTISAGDEILAVLNGVDTTTLTEASFVLMEPLA